MNHSFKVDVYERPLVDALRGVTMFAGVTCRPWCAIAVWQVRLVDGKSKYTKLHFLQ
jgi:hypothetical protein